MYILPVVPFSSLSSTLCVAFFFLLLSNGIRWGINSERASHGILQVKRTQCLVGHDL